MAETGVVRRPWRMAGAPFVVFVALMSSTLQEVQGQAEAAPPNTCSNQTPAKAISVSVDQNKKAVSFVCGEDMSQVLPSENNKEVSKCYMKKDLTGEKILTELFGPETTATVSPLTTRSEKQSSTVELTLGKLPERTTIIYFACTAATGAPGAAVPGGVPGAVPGKIGAVTATTAVENKCVVTVTVPADPAANTFQRGEVPVSMPPRNWFEFVSTIVYVLLPSLQQSPDLHLTPWWSSFLPAACTVQKQNMDLEITSENKSVSFQCDTGISTLSPTDSTTNIFDESCENEVTLAEKLPSASLTTTNSGYTFSVEELPETAITLCYKCSSPTDDTEESLERKNDACTVKVNVAAADLNSDSEASDSTGSVPTLIFAFVVSLLFTAVVV
uniref:SRS domain-containing protein n=1 Tax=Neospora caninum (strain Liverpool) TaxID=572307 RepID=F0JB60_NEOCL|nr:SRS domain-containing protein [Neospora caninum Liverpool]CEL71327.1 TPA: SRS domain-containing protein [Neospora caninum Liverpool]